MEFYYDDVFLDAIKLIMFAENSPHLSVSPKNTKNFDNNLGGNTNLFLICAYEQIPVIRMNKKSNSHRTV